MNINYLIFFNIKQILTFKTNKPHQNKEINENSIQIIINYTQITYNFIIINISVT